MAKENEIQFWQGLESARTSQTPGEGEPLWTTDEQKLYVGDGSTAGGILIGPQTSSGLTGTRSYTADGAISAGDPVQLNADGTVSVVGQLTEALGTSTQYSSINQAAIETCYCSADDYALVSYAVSSEIRCRLTTISGNTPTFGTEQTVTTTNHQNEHWLAYDSTNDKIVWVYWNTTSDIIYAKVGDITDQNTMTFGSETTVVDISSGIGPAPQACAMGMLGNGHFYVVYPYWESGQNNKTFIKIGTISGTSVTFSTAQEVGTDQPIGGYGIPVYDPVNDKGFLMYAVGSDVKAVHFYNYSSTGCTVGGITQVDNGYSGSSFVGCWDANAQRVVCSFADATANRSFVAFNTFGAAPVKGALNTWDTSNTGITFEGAAYDPETEECVFMYKNGSTDRDGWSKRVSVNPTSLVVTINDTVELYNGNIIRHSIVWHEDANRMLVCYESDSQSDNGYARAYQRTVGSTDGYKSFIGFADEAISDTASGDITVVGGLNTDVTGMPVGLPLYINKAGVIGTTPTEVHIGYAPTATSVVVNHDVDDLVLEFAAVQHEHTAADIDSESSANGAVLTSDGAGNAAWQAPTLPGEWSFTANGAISAGDAVALRSDGDIEIVKETNNTSLGTEQLTDTDSQFMGSCKLGDDKFLVAYRDVNGSGHGVCYVCTVSGTTITQGSVYTFNSDSTQYISCCQVDTDKAIILYRPNSGTGTAVIATASGTVVSFGSTASFNGSTTYTSCCQVETNKVCAAYCDNGNSTRPTLQVLTVSGTTITTNTEYVIQTSTSSYIDVCLINTNKVGVVYRDSQPDCRAAAATITGTTMSVGTSYVYDYDPMVEMTCCKAGTDKFAVVSKQSSNGWLYSHVITVSGTTITAGLNNQDSVVYANTPCLEYMEDDKVVCVYNSSSANAFKIGTITGGDISWDSGTTLKSTTNSGATCAVSKISATKWAFSYEYFDTYSRVYSDETITNADDYIGLATEAIADSNTGTVTIQGGINDQQSALTTGAVYYVDGDGTLITTANEVPAGVAISATEIVVGADPAFINHVHTAGDIDATTAIDGSVMIATVDDVAEWTADIRRTVDGVYLGYAGNDFFEWDESTGALTIGSGTGQKSDVLQVESNGTLNVSAVTNYEDLVTHDDDIPNKKYVDDAAGGQTAENQTSPRTCSAVADTTDTALTSNTWTVVAFDSADFDTGSDFDLTNNRFQPTVAGYYQINGHVYIAPDSTTCDGGFMRVWKNGTTSLQQVSDVAVNQNLSLRINTSIVAYLDGDTDYIQLQAYSANSDGDCTYATFSAHLIGTSLSTASAPRAARIHKNGTEQTGVAATTVTLISFSTADYDSASDADLSNDRFQPNVPGYYRVTLKATFGPTTSADYAVAYIRKNGTTDIAHSAMTNDSGSNNFHQNVISTIYLNGTTDYVDFTVYASHAGVVRGGTDATYAECYLLTGDQVQGARVCRVTRATTNQTLALSTWTEVDWNNTDFDAAGDFNLTNNRFTPSVPGYYQINTSIAVNPDSAAGDGGWVRVLKNGTWFAGQSDIFLNQDVASRVTCACLVYLNGTTDYLTVEAQCTGVAGVVEFDKTEFTAFLVPSTSGTPGITTTADSEVLILDAAKKATFKGEVELNSATPNLIFKDTDDTNGAYSQIDSNTINGRINIRADQGNNSANSAILFWVDGVRELYIDGSNMQLGESTAGSVGRIIRPINDGYTVISGGNGGAAGAAITYYGGTHAGSAGDMVFTSSNNQFMRWDESAGSLTLSTGTGAKTTALTLDSSQHATFSGNVVIDESDAAATELKVINSSATQDAIIRVYNGDGGMQFRADDAGAFLLSELDGAGLWTRNVMNYNYAANALYWYQDMRIHDANPALYFYDTDGTADERQSWIHGSDGDVTIQALTDAGAGGGQLWQFVRSGTNNISNLRGFSGGNTTVDLDNAGSEIRVGVDDTTYGHLQLYGAAVGQGGLITFDNAADSDTSFDAWQFYSYNGEMRLKPEGGTIRHYWEDDGKQNIVLTDDTCDATFNGILIDYNVSGSDACTANRAHRGLYIDCDSSATGGDITNEHRLYGLSVDARATGDSDLVHGAYIFTKAEPSAGTTTAAYGSYNYVQAYPTGTGAVSNCYGTFSLGYHGTANSVNNTYGVYGRANKIAAATGTSTNLIGVSGEIDVAEGCGVVSNGRAVQAIVDNNVTTNPTTVITNASLYYGAYEGTVPTVAWGVACLYSNQNLLSGSLNCGFGVTNAADTNIALQVRGHANANNSDACHMLFEDNAGNNMARITAYRAGSSTQGQLHFHTNNSGTMSKTLVIENDGTLNVAAVANYENLVTADDDIPNRKFVMDQIGSAGGGKVLQVVMGSATNNNSLGASLGNTSINVSITPSATTSKILVICYARLRLAANSGTISGNLARGTTNISEESNQTLHSHAPQSGGTMTSTASAVTLIDLDSPNTTSATTYRLRATDGTVDAAGYCDGGTIICMEIDGS